MDLELRLARFEQLIGRRPLLLNSVLLRQNPHHVHEWHKRVALHQGRPREVCDGPTPPSFPCLPAPTVQPDSVLPTQIINTYTEAVQTVDPFKATGKPHTLWVAFAKFYEDNGQLDDVSALRVWVCACVSRGVCLARGPRRHRHVHSRGGGRGPERQGPNLPSPTRAGPHHPGEGHQGELQAGGRPGQRVV